MRNKCILFAALLMLSGAISAKVVLPPMFSDNMVLQQQADAPVWGEAKPMKTVKVTTSWDGKTYETQANKEGKWKLSVRNTRPEPVTLTLYDQLPVSRNNNITVTAEEISGGRLDEAKGIITWQITLQPGEQRDLALRYKVKYPKGRNLIIE